MREDSYRTPRTESPGQHRRREISLTDSRSCRNFISISHFPGVLPRCRACSGWRNPITCCTRPTGLMPRIRSWARLPGCTNATHLTIAHAHRSTVGTPKNCSRGCESKRLASGCLRTRGTRVHMMVDHLPFAVFEPKDVGCALIETDHRTVG